MFKKTMIATAVAMVLSNSVAVAEEEESIIDGWEIAGELKNESAVFTESGQGIGATTTSTQTTDTHGKDVYKSESSARIFINGDVGDEGSSFHAELNLRNDGEAISGYKGSKSYTQHDILRELYIDTEVGDEENPIAIRAGKQQVVWGTADGIKLLDIINPTDWREFAQNTMEDSRIPVWMVNAEKDLESGGNIQFVLSQSEENKIPGLGIASGSATSHTNGDQGHPFMMKGVDTITGKVHGFLNVGPALGAVATTFGNLGNTTGMSQADVDDFISNNGSSQAANFRSICEGGTVGVSGTVTSAKCMNAVVNSADLLATNGSGSGTNNANAQNLFSDTSAANDTTAWDAEKLNPTQMFSYLHDATFATFVSFEGMTSEYRVNKPSDSDLNTGARFKDSTDDGLNYSVNYLYHYDSNPYVDVHWENSSGVEKSEVRSTAGTDSETYVTGSAYVTNTVDSASKNLVLVFTEKYKRIHSLGASFDYALDTEMAPIVLRGEFLYDKDVMTPVITRRASNGVDISHGFLTSSLNNQQADFFKYVLGADVTVMTNLMLSGQFIQMRNLDFVDEGSSTGSNWRYTGDSATMHLTNNLKKGEENEEFYSFFMSKPFGAEQQHRWNNIFMYEEDGGKWDRFDVEYSFTDELIGLAEYNKYWGDANTQFGQMEKSSNFQLGLKYIF